MSPLGSVNLRAGADFQGLLDERTRVKRVLEVSREDGQDPLRISRIGDETRFEAATKEVASAATVTVWLTQNRGARGGSLFRTKPFVEVERTTETLIRAGGPSSPSKNLDLTLHTNRMVCWDGANEVWKVVITNDSGAAAFFHVKARD